MISHAFTVDLTTNDFTVHTYFMPRSVAGPEN